MKIFRRVLLVVVVLIVVGVGVLYFSLDRIVRSTVETQSTNSLKLDTKLGGAKLALFGGKLNLNDLQIASPQGFAAPHMLTLGDADVAVTYGQLRSDPVHVSALTLRKPKLVIERAGGRMNFKAAMDQMPKGPDQPAEPDKKPLKLVIDELSVQDAQVVIRPGAEIPGLPAEFTIPVPSILMKNVGTGDGNQNGAAIKDVAMQVITALAGHAANSGSLPDALKAMLHIDVAQVVSQFGAEAQKRIIAAVPGPMGETLSNVIKDPQALMKDPAKAIQGALPSNLQGKVQDALQGKAGDALGGTLKDQLGGLLPGQKSPDTAPSTQPDSASPDASNPTKAIEDGLQGLLKKKSKPKSQP